MTFFRGAWRILVGIKDGLVLAFMLLFFAALFAALTFRPNAASVRDGALLLELDGTLVEEPAEVDPLSLLTSGDDTLLEYRTRDVVRAVRAAASDGRIKAVVLDLDRFMGGGQASLSDLGAALDSVRKAGKPVLAFATGYTDDGYQLAAHASEIWVDPLGGAVPTGPGGNRLYYKGLLDRLEVTAHIYRAGTFKAAVEPYSRTDQSPEAETALRAVYDALWSGWQREVARVRPKARIDRFVADPAGAVLANGGDLARTSLALGLVDKLGDRTAFGTRVAQIVGDDDSGRPGAFASTPMEAMLAAHPLPAAGSPVAVVTIAGEIVDGDAGPGQAGGDRIAGLLDDALARDDLKALVVRVNSPGGSVLASERIRLAIQRHRDAGRPVVVSMGDLAASGGYWVSTPGQAIFADPLTITGSIGVFGVLPTFEQALGNIGINADGVATTPLSGQPDLAGGLSPAVDTILQASVDSYYRDFIALVARARGTSTQAVDRIGQGRIWDGRAAARLGLVDRMGGLDMALAEAARRAKLPDGQWHPVYLGDTAPGWTARLAQAMQGNRRAGARADLLGMAQARQQALLAGIAQDMAGLTARRGAQALCFECPRPSAPRRAADEAAWMPALLQALTGR